MIRLREERGLAGVMLIIVIAWALLAVFMLTRTLISAQQIDDRVVRIMNEVQPIDKDLDSVKLVETTNQIADEIEAAAKPLSGQLDQVIAAQIPEKAVSILDTAGKINQTVLTINETITPLGGTVTSINENATAINQTVDSIKANATSINRFVHSIFGSASGILGNASSINRGVKDINDRADVTIAVVRAIRGNTQGIDNVVPAIDRHANEIDCTVVVKTLADLRTVLSKGKGSACER